METQDIKDCDSLLRRICPELSSIQRTDIAKHLIKVMESVCKRICSSEESEETPYMLKGPINIGDSFIWRPGTTYKRRVTVIDIDGYKLRYRDEKGNAHYSFTNDFREACHPVDIIEEHIDEVSRCANYLRSTDPCIAEILITSVNTLREMRMKSENKKSLS